MKSKNISILKENDPISYLISLFHILREEASDKDWIQEGSQIRWIPKEPNNIQLDYAELHNKVMSWMSDKGNLSSLDLNQVDSDILRKCSHAAYYFITEDDYPIKKRSEKFIKFHETYFRDIM